LKNNQNMTQLNQLTL